LSFQFEQAPHLTAWRLHQLSDGSLQLYFDSDRPEITRQFLVRHIAEALPDQPCRITEGIWQLDRPGKFKRISSDLESEMHRAESGSGNYANLNQETAVSGTDNGDDAWR
jgi:hypothetical protein